MKQRKKWVIFEVLILALAVGAAVFVGVTSKKPEDPQKKETTPYASSEDTKPESTEPEPTVTESEPTEPESTEPEPTESKPTEPEPTEPEPTEPEPTEPKPTEPKPTEPKPTEPEPTVPEPTNPQTGGGKVVVIDAGHRANGGWSEKEPNGPGSAVLKAKLTTGTACTVDGVYYTEHEVNLQVALKLQKVLEARGYTVIQVRTGGESNLSNADRAVLANNAHADVFIRIHCNGSDNTSVNGVLTYAPSPNNPYMAGQTSRGKSLASESIRLSQLILSAVSAQTGARNAGMLYGDDMTGINWCQVPVTIVEMGFMSNPEEARKLTSDAYQEQMALGMAAGIDAFLQ